jgi:prophage regulatory protein
MTQTKTTINHAVPIKEFAAQLAISKSGLWEKLNPRSRYFDPDMPQPFKIGRSTRFLQSQIDDYINAKICASRIKSKDEGGQNGN